MPDLEVCLSFRNQPPHLVRGEKYAYYSDLYKSCIGGGKIHFSTNSTSGGKGYAEWLGIRHETVRHMENILDPDLFEMDRDKTRASKRYSMGWQDETIVVLGVFRLVPQKRPDLFLGIAQHLCKEDPRIRICLVGGGELYSQLEKQIAGASLSDRIVLTGYRNDVWELMCAADLLLHTSAFEGTPNVIMEAQSLKLPVLSTAVGGVPSLVKHRKTGLLCESETEDAFVELVRELINEPNLAHSLREAAYQARQLDCSGKGWLAYIKEILGANSSAARELDDISSPAGR